MESVGTCFTNPENGKAEVGVATFIPSYLERFDRPKRGLGGVLDRFTRSYMHRKEVHLGARTAVECVHEALRRFYKLGEILLVHPWDKNAYSGGDPRVGGSEGTVTAPVRVVVPRELKDLRSFVLFEPSSILPERLDFRHAYLKRSVPVVFLHHTISYRHHLKELFMDLVLSPTLESDSIVCSSNAARTAIVRLLDHVCEAADLPRNRYKGRLDVIPFGVDIDRFRPLSKNESRKQFGIAGSGFVMLCFGRRSPADKADLLPLLYAFRELKKRVPEAQLVIAGNPRDSKSDVLAVEMRSRGLGDGVTSVWGISEEEKPYLYNAADVFVSFADSIQECFGLTVVEAMACGIPQIVSDWNGYRELVDHGATGFRARTVWAKCDEEIAVDGTRYPHEFLLDHFRLGQSVAVDFTSALEWMELLAKKSELHKAMSEASVRRARAEFSYPIMVARYSALFTEVLRQAQTVRECYERPRVYKLPAYYKCFLADATSELSSAAVLRWHKERAAMVLNVPMPYKSLFAVGPYEGWKLSRIAAIVSQSSNGISVLDLLKKLGPDEDGEHVLRQILWLIKYGCIVCEMD